MAIYHCSVKIVSRNTGRSAVAAAAYRSGDVITNEFDGIKHDYSRKGWIEHTEIILPYNAKKEYSDRSKLWNSVELSQKSIDAQLAREFELALPKELTMEENIELVNRFANDMLVRSGMIVDYAIHNPPMMNDRHQPITKDGLVTKNADEMIFNNPHTHILVPMRPVDENGEWQKKSQKEYLCKNENGEIKGLTSDELKADLEHLWQKQYKYKVDNKNVWMTPTEALAGNYEKASREPKTSPYGRKNPVIEEWDSKEKLVECRRYWERIVNEALSKKNIKLVDCRSFKEQGIIDMLPTVHMGVAASNIEKRARRIEAESGQIKAVKSDIGDLNRAIEEHNGIVSILKELAVRIKNIGSELFAKLGLLKKEADSKRKAIYAIRRKENILEEQVSDLSSRIDKYVTTINDTETADLAAAKRIVALEKQLKNANMFSVRNKNKIKKLIADEQYGIERRKEMVINIARLCNITSNEDLTSTRTKLISYLSEINDLKNEEVIIQTSIDELEKEIKCLEAENNIRTLELQQEKSNANARTI